MSKGNCEVVVVGSFNVDHVWRCEALPAPGATLAGEYASGPGGKGFNQAIAAARAGARLITWLEHRKKMVTSDLIHLL